MSELPETMDGHWATPDGRLMAESYLAKSREELCYGHLSDLELANAVFMANRDDLNLIGFQEAAKQRIRWLSAQLAWARGEQSDRSELLNQVQR